MALLSDFGTHVQLCKVFRDGEALALFPRTTADEVFADENGNTVDNYLFSIVHDNSLYPMGAETTGTVTVTDSLAALLVS